MNMTRAELIETLKGFLNLSTLSSMVLSQIDKYVLEHGWSYLEIARAVAYLTDVQKKTLDVERYGIGLVPLVMDEARAYFEEKRQTKLRQEAAAERFMANQASGKYIYYVKNPRRRPKNFKFRKEIDIRSLGKEDADKE